MKPIEQILCSPTNELPVEWLPEDGYMSLSWNDFLRVMSQKKPVWKPRDEVENNPDFKQWIPYVLVQNSGNKFATYPRQGSESRLHGVWSVGVGGHINFEDRILDKSGNFLWGETIQKGLARELSEEFPSAISENLHFLGLIHERKSKIGQVHLGMVFISQAYSGNQTIGAELTGMEWIELSRVGSEPWNENRFERWSLLAMKLFQSV